MSEKYCDHGLYGAAVVTANTTNANATLTVTSVTSGRLGLGALITGPNIPANAYISALGTGTGGTGTYTMNFNASSTATGSTIVAEMGGPALVPDWASEGTNAGYPLAFDSVGGEIPAIPLYLFSKNGWDTVPMAANHTLNVVNGIYERAGGGDPFIDPVGSYKIRINRIVPGIAIGYSTSGVSGPSSSDIASAVINNTVESNLTLSGILKIILAAIVGKTTGVGSSTETYLAQNGTTQRIVVGFDSNNNRTSVTLDAQ
jgi:hypothetical protein